MCAPPFFQVETLAGFAHVNGLALFYVRFLGFWNMGAVPGAAKFYCVVVSLRAIFITLNSW